MPRTLPYNGAARQSYRSGQSRESRLDVPHPHQDITSGGREQRARLGDCMYACQSVTDQAILNWLLHPGVSLEVLVFP